MRCDAETNGGACNAFAKWEAETPTGTVYCCNRHFLQPSPPEWVDLPWRGAGATEAQAQHEHFWDEYNFESNYTAER